MTAHAPFVLLALTQDPGNPTDGPADKGQAGGGAESTATQTPGGPAPGQVNPCSDPNTLMMFGLFGLLMYFMILRPEQRRRKEAQKMMSSLQKGDTVVTNGGLHGEIAAINDKTITLKVDTVRMTFDKAAIVRVERDEAAKGDAKK
ncbi:MAG: Preprotein translocase subunit YajC [Planctomycetota bacterium]|jgi:preprotein translocase subunit YajC